MGKILTPVMVHLHWQLSRLDLGSPKGLNSGHVGDVSSQMFN